MTVAAEIPLAIYDGDGVTTAFPAPWRYLDPAQLVVELVAVSGAVTLQLINTDYTASAGTTDTGGMVTMTIAPASGEELRVRRATPLAQPTAYPTSGAFPARSHELALDRLTLIGQEQSESISRSAQVPPGDPGPLLTGLPDAVQNSVLAFDVETGTWRPVGEGDWVAWRDSAQAAIEGTGDAEVERVELAGETIIDAVGAVRQVLRIAIQDDVVLREGAYFIEFFHPTPTLYDEWRAWVYLDEGTVDVQVNVNTIDVYGPRTVGTTIDTADPALTIGVDAQIAIQLSNVSGTPRGVAIYMWGLPA